MSRQSVNHQTGLLTAWDTLSARGPSDSLTFLEITLDTQWTEARFPAEKLQRICTSVSWWHQKKRLLSEKYHCLWDYFNKGSEAWSYICSTHACHCSQGKIVVLLYQTHQRVSLGLSMVALDGMVSVSSTMPSLLVLAHAVFRYTLMPLALGAMEHILMADGFSFLGL